MAAPRIALVGYGRIAPKHLEALRGAGAEVVASCNRSEAGRAKAKSEGGIAHVYAELDAMLREERPDAVVCAVSFFEVFSVAKALIPTGVPLLLEKPPGTSLAEFDELRALAAKHQTPVMVGVNRRHYGVLRNAIADAGGVDAITHVDLDWSEDASHFLARGFTEAQVAKMVFGNSLHGLDLLAYLAGRIEKPAVAVRKGSGRFEWNMALQGTSTRGATASFRSTWASPGRWRLQFCTTGRRYTFAPLESCAVQQTGVKEDRVIAADEHDARFKPGFFAQSQALLEMIRTRVAPPSCSLDAVAPSMELAEHLTNALA